MKTYKKTTAILTLALVLLIFTSVPLLADDDIPVNATPPEVHDPAIVGPAEFTQTVQSALDLIKDKDYESYKYIANGMTTIIYSDFLKENDTIAEIDTNTKLVFFNGIKYEKNIAVGETRQKTYVVLELLAHEATHMHLKESTINKEISPNDIELICEITGLRIIEKAGATKDDYEYQLCKKTAEALISF